MPIYTTSEFVLSYFGFNAVWLVALNYANPSFLMGISFLSLFNLPQLSHEHE
jgi:hypothetical protein